MMGIVVAMIECIIIVNFIIKSLEPKKPNRKWLLYAILTALLLVDLHIGKMIFKSESIPKKNSKQAYLLFGNANRIVLLLSSLERF